MDRHFLISVFQVSTKENGNNEYCRSGIKNPTQLLMTGLMIFMTQCCVLPWVIIILSCQPGIVGAWGNVKPLYSFEWWILAIIVLGSYLICLCMAKRFADLCFSQFYFEKIIVSNDSLILQKKQTPLYQKNMSFNFDLLVKVLVQNDEMFLQKYSFLYPPPDEYFIKSYEKEYRLCFIVHKSISIVIDTLFIQEVQTILHDLQKRQDIQIEYQCNIICP
ncbi:MAG: hypothetical protein LBE12_16170 [Planctomycetaceae bacterium]|jgi:hypothetical protein|nr:hypothetical protein [Planctomycetaceae bacterium]